MVYSSNFVKLKTLTKKLFPYGEPGNKVPFIFGNK